MLAFLLPALVASIHSTEDHTHYDTCTLAGETHVHETLLNCDLGDLHMVKAGVVAFAKAYPLSTPITSKEKDVLFEKRYYLSVEFSSDRGPPTC